jgi:hypothetical protein
VRSVLTLSDLGGAIIEGADFSDAVIDLPQKQVHNKYLNSSIIARMTLFCEHAKGLHVKFYRGKDRKCVTRRYRLNR